jgi:hypothetical protein
MILVLKIMIALAGYDILKSYPWRLFGFNLKRVHQYTETIENPKGPMYMRIETGYTIESTLYFLINYPERLFKPKYSKGWYLFKTTKRIKHDL